MLLGVTDLWTYVIATVLVILLPGPNSLYVLSVAARKGVRDGYRAAAAVFVGDSVLMIASAAGVASLLQTSPVLFTIVKYAGAIYLAYLGVMLIRSGIKTWRARRTDDADAPAETTNLERPFRRAFIASLLNPKAILFFVAFFVQFVDPAYPYPALSFLLLGAIVQVCSLTYLSVLIFSGNALASAFRRRRRLSSLGTGGIGAVMLGFAAKLSTASM
ncbi:leucine efflux protein LeuE [Stackebrandtia nassauensis]|uniref:Lysine exporter protein (LYSE/YGGA) n=1 Tax=Stackebrandtia nassauensis (strain DSM 44728 / CIP 108903 / NRRL B-16338 / NBRC 102104 / LLR-40K-21) TaxID=446470 RepID=D3Q2A5_STANL|nr:leucine efflux protein LeuE [Stackebrandtia nassauensis]ADD43838.1 Lysine exporter protein (LYSE/YGGA) [Stackebrandtia nassauensis DSM 44728]